MQEYVMGNGAIALGALAAGVNLVSGYPGTPSSEIVETISKYPHDGVHLEWSVNEKAAMDTWTLYSSDRCKLYHPRKSRKLCFKESGSSFYL